MVVRAEVGAAGSVEPLNFHLIIEAPKEPPTRPALEGPRER